MQFGAEALFQKISYFQVRNDYLLQRIVNMEIKTCPVCGKEYRSPWKTCSKECGNKTKGEKLKQRAALLREERMEERKHFCLTCGKELFDSRKFCSRSCAARYTNARREKFHWSEEKRKAASRRILVSHGKDPDNPEPKRCRHCGEIIQKGRCCKVCRPYVQYAGTFSKLGIEGKNLQEKFEVLWTAVSKLYFEENRSMPEIGAKMGLWRRQLELIFKKAGVQCRTLSEAERNAFETGRLKLSPRNSKYSHGWHTTWQGTEIYYRSSYELEYAQELDSQKIPYEVESKRIRYFDTEKQKERIAVPDFYLPETNELVEVKSTYTFKSQEMKDKFRAYRDSGFIPRLWLDKRYCELAL